MAMCGIITINGDPFVAIPFLSLSCCPTNEGLLRLALNGNASQGLRLFDFTRALVLVGNMLSADVTHVRDEFGVYANLYGEMTC